MLLFSYLCTRPEPSPATRRLTSSAVDRLKSSSMVCFRQEAAAAYSMVSWLSNWCNIAYMRPAAKAQKSRTARPEGTEEMTVTIEYEAEERLEVPYEEIIRNVVEEALDYVECPYDAEVNVVLTDNEGIHQINLDMRGIDRPTDVLSFPMCDFETPGDFDGLEETPEEYFNPDTGELMLGDIVISVEKVKEQAEKFGHSETRELAFLVAHSMLHLSGYDHMEDEERLDMEEKQREILERRGYRR